MQGRDDPIHLIEDCCALRARETGQSRIPEHPTLDIVHHVEDGADHALVVAQTDRPGDRYAGIRKRGDHAVFPVDRMGRGQELARRLAPQHPAPLAGAQEIGRVGLAALELRRA